MCCFSSGTSRTGARLHRNQQFVLLRRPPVLMSAAAASASSASTSTFEAARGKLAVTQPHSCPGSSQQRQRRSGKAQPAAVDYLTSEEPLLLLHAAVISGNGPASAWKAASATSFRPCTPGPCRLSKQRLLCRQCAVHMHGALAHGSAAVMRWSSCCCAECAPSHRLATVCGGRPDVALQASAIADSMLVAESLGFTRGEHCSGYGSG